MEEWKLTKIGSLCKRVCSGGTPKSTVEEYYGGGIPWLNTKEVNFNRIYSTESTISVAGLNNSSAKWIDKHSVIVAMYGATAAKCAIGMIPMTTNQACCNLMIDEALADYRFVYYALTNAYSTLASLANGGAQQNLNAQLIKDFEIPLPDLQTQHRIADILSTIDDKIENNTRINHNLEEQAQALYKSWFVDFEPFKDGKFVYSELGLIPEGWRIGKISDIATVTSGKRPNVKYESSSAEHSIPVFGASSVMAFTDSVYLKERAIITGRVGTLGILQRVDFPCWPSDNTLIIQSPYENFVYQELGEVDYSSLNRGSTQPLLTQSDLKSWSIIIPPKEIIAEYESLIRDNTDLIAEHCVQNQRLSLLRDTLLPQLMSGQLTC